MRPIRRKSLGFTLLELALVIAIISILSAIAVPRYANSIGNYRVTATARRISADILLAQSRARALSTSQSIVFSVPQNQYQITGMADPDHPGSTYTVNLTDQTTSCTLTSATFGSGSTLTLSGFGIPSSGGTIQVSSGKATRTLTIDQDTGGATIQ